MGGIESLALVGIEGRCIGHGQEFTRSCIDHDGSSSLGLVPCHGVLNCTVCNRLNAGIDRQTDILTWGGRP